MKIKKLFISVLIFSLLSPLLSASTNSEPVETFDPDKDTDSWVQWTSKDPNNDRWMTGAASLAGAAASLVALGTWACRSDKHGGWLGFVLFGLAVAVGDLALFGPYYFIENDSDYIKIVGNEEAPTVLQAFYVGHNDDYEDSNNQLFKEVVIDSSGSFQISLNGLWVDGTLFPGSGKQEELTEDTNFNLPNLPVDLKCAFSDVPDPNTYKVLVCHTDQNSDWFINAQLLHENSSSFEKNYPHPNIDKITAIVKNSLGNTNNTSLRAFVTDSPYLTPANEDF